MNLVERIMKNTGIGEYDNVYSYLGFLPNEIIKEEFKLAEGAERQLYRLVEYLHKNFKDSYNHM